MKTLDGIMPSLMARKGVAGRASVAEAFNRSLFAEGHKQV